MRDEDQFFRRITLLKHLPTCGRGKRTTQDFHALLHREGLQSTVRTVQRDLNWLSGHFPVFGDGSNPQGWCWRGDHILGIPMMDVPMALAWMMAGSVLQPLLPASLLNELESYFNQARGILAQSPLKDWTRRVQVLNEGIQKPIHSQGVIHNRLVEAMEQGRQVEMIYLSPQRTEPKIHLLHPWGLVLRDGILYFVGMTEGRESPTLFAVHRIQGLVILNSSSVPMPQSFDLRHFARQSLSFAEPGETFLLRLQVTRDMAFVLEERPLSEDQRMERRGREWITFTATVNDSQQLRWWILSFGPAMRVVDPPELFREMRDIIVEAARHYARRPPARKKDRLENL